MEKPKGAPKAQPRIKIIASVMLSPPKHKYIISDISVIINWHYYRNIGIIFVYYYRLFGNISDNIFSPNSRHSRKVGK